MVKTQLKAKLAQNGENAAYKPNWLKMVKMQLTSQIGSKW